MEQTTMEAKSGTPPESVERTLSLPVKLAAKEFDEASRQLADLEVQKERLENALKEHNDAEKAKIKAITTQIYPLARKINLGVPSQVKCRVSLNCPVTGVMQVIRLDTGEMFDRDMSSDDFQEELELESTIHPGACVEAEDGQHDYLETDGELTTCRHCDQLKPVPQAEADPEDGEEEEPGESE